MPVNNNALFRYRILDRCFSDRQNYYRIEDLLEEVNENLEQDKNISLRQLRTDIQKMRDRFDAPIKAVSYESRKCCYRYLDEKFSIFRSELSEEDFNVLRSTIDMLGKYCGTLQNAWLEGKIPVCFFKTYSQSQEIIASEECKLKIEVKVNRELYQQIFSFLPDVEVLSPQWLRDDIKKKLKKNRKNIYMCRKAA